MLATGEKRSRSHAVAQGWPTFTHAAAVVAAHVVWEFRRRPGAGGGIGALCNDGRDDDDSNTGGGGAGSRAKSRAKKCSEFVELLLMKQASLLVSPSSSSQQARKNHYVFTVLRCSCNDDWGLELLLLLTAVARRRQALLLPFLACIGASDDGSCRQSSQIRIMFFAIGKWWPWPSPSSLYCCSTEDHCVPQ